MLLFDPDKRITAADALKHYWFQRPNPPDDGTEAAKLEKRRQAFDMSLPK